MVFSSRKTLLAKLKYNNPQKYEEYLKKWNIAEKDLYLEIEREADRLRALAKIRRLIPTKESIHSIPNEYKKSIIDANKARGRKKQTESNHGKRKCSLILVDGDNISNAELIQLNYAKNSNVKLFLSKEEQIENIKEQVSNDIIKVTPGDQAVDNRIKSELGQMVKNNIYESICIVSHDRGYDELLQQYRSSYGMKKKKLQRVEDIGKLV